MLPLGETYSGHLFNDVSLPVFFSSGTNNFGISSHLHYTNERVEMEKFC
jgi:hypothetical protein